ncbi:MAG: hypothetical protein JSW49_01245, partial [candidate division WOR-3 bacterium]
VLDLLGYGGIRLGDEAFITGKRAGLNLLEAVDSNTTDVARLNENLLDPMLDYGYSQSALHALRTAETPQLWTIGELPRVGRAKAILGRVKDVPTHDGRVGHWHQMRNRAVAQVSVRAPGKIDLMDEVEGARDLANWIRICGGHHDTANKWANRFRKTPAGQRHRTVIMALQELGDEIDHPLLAYGLNRYASKQGQYTYFFDRWGRELGLSITRDGKTTIRPSSISHYTRDFPMPDPKEMLKSINRFKTTRRGPARLGRIRSGILPKTKKNRQMLVDGYKVRLKKATGKTYNQLHLTEDDLMAMAYADVLGTGKINRVNGLGYVQKITSMAIKPLRIFHHVFSLAQLAGRPIAWCSRVLLEESVRANHVGLPSFWRNPKEYLNAFWDANVVRRLPDHQDEMVAYINKYIDDLFSKDPTDVMYNLYQDMPEVLNRAHALGVDPDDLDKMRALAAHEMSRTLIGGDARMMADRTYVTKEVLKRNKKMNKAYEKLEARGMSRSFNFNTDGAEILNHSLFSWFTDEAASATVPIEWALGRMSSDMVNTYGRAYGRQMYQALSDPIVSRFGINRALARAQNGESAKYTVNAFMNTREWHAIRPNAVDMAAYHRKHFTSDYDLAKWYLDNIINEMVETLFEPFWKVNGQIDPVRMETVLESLAETKSMSVELGGRNYNLSWHAEGYETFLSQAAHIAQAAYNNEIELPMKIAAYFDLRSGQRLRDKSIPRRFANATLRVFGESATQKLMRQPAYMHTHGKYYNYYTKLGMDHKTAQAMAHHKAVEVVNWAFFNNSQASMFLRRMNEVIPFFSAWWEVLSTWAYKIPSSDWLAVGYPALIRRVDRF